MNGSKPMGRKEIAALRQLATQQIEKNTDAVDFAFWSGLHAKCCVAMFHSDPETQKEAEIGICDRLNRAIKMASAATGKDLIVFLTVWGDDE